MITLPQAIAIIGSVCTICYTLLKLIGPPSKKDLDKDNALLNNDIENISERLDKVEHNLEKLQDLIIDLLKDE